MQAQTRREDQRAQTILVVEEDEATRRLLDLTLRHAGFNVVGASGGDEAGRRLGESPDLLIAPSDDAGLALCRQAKQSPSGVPCAVLLISAPDVDSKRRGLEAGADDFVARPLYVQEVVARSRALLQRRERERIEMSAQQSDRFVSALEDVPLIDLVRAIAANQKSGVALVVDSLGARGEIYFRQGRVVDAEVGRLSGRDAVFRLFCWTTGRLEVDWKSIRRKDTVEMPSQELLMEALRRVDDWRRLLAAMPPLETILEVDYRLLAERLADIPDEVNRILRLFDGMRTIIQVIDDCGLPDLDAAAAIGKLCRERIVHDVRVPLDEEEAMGGADMEGWLSDAAGPFRAPPRVERELFGAGPSGGSGVHGRPTAPLEPLGEGPRDALDDDMRSRFTDRLQAEGATAAPEPAPVDAPAPALAVPPAESGPSGDGTRPTTLPGMGTAPSEESEEARLAAALTIETTEEEESPAQAAPQAAASDVDSASLPFLRQPRTVSGEILVKRPSAKMKPSADVPLPKARTTDPKNTPLPYMRPSQSTTPPGSARALDELPPLTESGASRAAGAPEALAGEAESFLAAAGGEDRDAARSARRRGLMIAGGVAATVVLAVVALVGSQSSGNDGDNDRPTVAATKPAPQGVVQPLGAAPGPAPTTDSKGPGAPRPDTGDKAGPSRTLAVAPVPAAEPLEERNADPKLARTRAAEAGTLLSGCHAAFSEGRMKDAEAACTAAKDANPESAEAYGLLAHALFNRNNRRKEALAAAEHAIKLNPKWADAYVIIGGVHQDQGDTAEAKRAYQKYLDLDPKGQYAADLRAIVGKLEPGLEPAKL